MPATRYRHSQSTLDDGTVLVTGGYVAGTQSADVQQYNLSTNAWTAKAAMPAAMQIHAQSTLNDGTVLVTGGNTDDVSDVQQYDLSTNTWTAKTAMVDARYFHNQSTLDDGTVLLTGGNYLGSRSDDVMQYDPAGDTPITGRAALLGYLAST